MMRKRWSVWDGDRVVYASNSPAEVHNFAERFATVYGRTVMVRYKDMKYEHEYEVPPAEKNEEEAKNEIKMPFLRS